ncbi:MAG: porin [Bacteroidota bacterium]
MKIKYFLFFAVFSIFILKVSSQEKKSNPFQVKWDNGFKIESQDKNFKLKFGGRIHLDHAYFSQDNDLDAAFGELESNDGTEFRRARFFISGVLYKNVEFKLQMDYAGGAAKMKDVYIGVKNIPIVGRIRVGHMKEPLRFDALTSSKYITFMERAIPGDIANERNNGILLMNDFFDKKLSIQTGIFRNADVFGNDKEAARDIAWTSRITTLVINNIEKEQLLHFGFSYSYRKPDREDYKISVRPKSHLANKYISTGNIEGIETVNIINFETAFTSGPLTFQGEYLRSLVKQELAGLSETYKFNNYYGQISYFLTGEHKPYKNSYANFSRVKPTHNFFGVDNKGIGAWEVALRYTHTDLNSGDLYGGVQSDITLGTNWYLNPATRVMFNYVWTDIEQNNVGGGNLNIFEIRFQIDF